MADSERDYLTDGDVARQAVIHSLVSNGVYLLLMAGFMLAVARRDELAALVERARQAGHRTPPEPREALRELHRDIARFEGREP